MTATEALRQAGRLGPYFAVEAQATGPGWRPLADLVHDAAVVGERVSFVRSALAARCAVPVEAIDARAAASIHFLGLASRLVAPSLAVATLTGAVATFDVADVAWQRVDGGPVPIAVTEPEAVPVDDAAAAAAALEQGVLNPVVAPVLAAFGAAVGVSPIVLWGNVASALAGAAAMLRRSDARLVLDPVEVAAAVFARPGPLAAAGRFGVRDRFFVRASCCLFYRVPNAGKCGDCVLL